MRGRVLPHRPPPPRLWLALAWALAFLGVAVVSPLSVAGAPAVAAEAGPEAAIEPTVTDVQPAPGAVVPAGPVVVAASITVGAGAAARFTIDGEPARGRPVDPDGDLSRLRGVEVALEPGRHRLAVVVGPAGAAREVSAWEIDVAGVDIAVATQGPAALAERLDPARDRPGPAVVYDSRQPALALAVPLLAALLDGVAVAVEGGAVDDAAWRRIRASSGGALLVGDIVSPHVEAALRDVGRDPVRLHGATAADLAAAATAHVGGRVRAVVVGPAEPFDRALTAAGAAARLGAGLVLVGPDGPSQASADLIAAAPTLLLSTDLPQAHRQLVTDLMAPQAVSSDDDLVPALAQEAIVIPETADRVRAIAAVAAADVDRPALVGLPDAARWTAQARPDRLTIVGPSQPPLPLTGLHDPLLPALATTPALDPSAMALETVVRPALPVARPAPTDGEDQRPAPASGGVVIDVDGIAAELRRAWVDGPDAPTVEALVDPTDGLSITLTADAEVADAGIHVGILGYEWPGTLVVEGRTARWEGDNRPPLPLPLEPGGSETPVEVTVTTVITADGARRHQTYRAVVGVDPADTVSPEGWVVAGGTDPVVGTGRAYTYSVEVEPATGLDVDEVVAEVSRILSDPRSWTGDGTLSLRRVGTADARLRVVVARPSTVDAYCGAAGLRTGGRVSCWDGYRAMLNLDRWNTGVSPFHTDLEVYRQYLVNHEVGHGLGHGHEFCPRPGVLAPVMQQQTGGLGACEANGWPFPDRG